MGAASALHVDVHTADSYDATEHVGDTRAGGRHTYFWGYVRKWAHNARLKVSGPDLLGGE